MATSRPQTPAHDSYGAGAYGDTHLSATPGNPIETSPLSQSVQQPTRDPRFQEDFDTSRRGSSILDAGLGGTGGMLRRADSTASISGQQLQPAIPPSRGGTLKKKAALSRNASLKRSNSRRSSHAGSVRSLALGEREKYDGTDELNNAFFTPVPTQGNPTEILIDRFQAWRKVLKDLVAYFREIQNSYEQRSKSVLKVSNIMGNMHLPSLFLSEGGIGDANNILRSYHKQAITDSNKAKELENNVILQLTGLRSDLQQKIKEIKSLSGDFKNSVDKEMEVTKKAVHGLQEALGVINTDPSAIAGKGDPFIVKLAVERQIERQIDEENYLHRAHLNLESSGRELESIVVGEIQKAYNVYAGLLKKDADEAYDTVEKLRSGPVALPKDHEWQAFVTNDNHFINPQLPLRHAEDIYYPGRDDAAAAEVRSGMLERKSKYLKSYTAGWYVLSPTHLHEFKSADRINAQPPVMSLLLPDQKLGSHAQPGSSSHKFILKGRQTGSMHRGHSWVFRAESHDTMLAWYEDIKALTEKSGAERDTYVRKHARSISQTSQKAGSISSDGGMDEDEADSIPYSGAGGIVPPTNQYNNNIQQNTTALAMQQQKPKRPSPGGRFPSDIQLETLRDGGLLANATISDSGSDPDRDRDVIAAAAGMPGTSGPLAFGGDEGRSSHPFDAEGSASSSQLRYRHGESALAAASTDGGEYEGIYTPVADRDYAQQNALPSPPEIERHDSKYGDWMSPRAPSASTGNGGAATTTTAAATAAAYEHQARKAGTEQEQVPVIDTAAETAAARQRGHTQSSTSSRPFEMMGGAASSQVGSVSTMPSTVAEGVVGQEDGELGGSGGVGKLDGELGGKGGAAAFAPTSSEASTALSGEGDRRADSMLSTESSRLSHLHVPGEFPPTPPAR